MKKYNFSLLIIATLIIVPSVALASWWNPFSWFRKDTVQTSVVQVVAQSNNKEIEDLKKEVIDLKKPKTQNKSTSDKTIFSNPVFVPLQDFTSLLPDQNDTGRLGNNKVKTDYRSSITAIDTFLSNPTLENLKTFCITAKTLQGIGTKKVFNDTRTDFVMKANTLYDNANTGNICSIALGENKNTPQYNWTAYNPLYVVGFDDSSESDAMRKAKISYNTYWNSLSKYKLIGYWSNNGANTPKQMMENIVNNRPYSKSNVRLDSGLSVYQTERGISSLFLVPEQRLLVIKNGMK